MRAAKIQADRSPRVRGSEALDQKADQKAQVTQLYKSCGLGHVCHWRKGVRKDFDVRTPADSPLIRNFFATTSLRIQRKVTFQANHRLARPAIHLLP
jgi:hypothetical protein